MSETKHTPGPWYIMYRSPDRTNIRVQIEHRTESRSSPVAFVELAKRYDWGEADARLMAASPDLLEACELALRILGRDGLQEIRGEAWTDGERERLELAVSRAKGE